MQLGLKKRIKKAAKANQYNLDIVAIDEWDGDPSTEPTL
jgi:hypothetical protein